MTRRLTALLFLVAAGLVGGSAAAQPGGAAGARQPSGDRTEFCWVAVTNAVLRQAVQGDRSSARYRGLTDAMAFLNGKMRGRYGDDGALVDAMVAGMAEFADVDVEQATQECMAAYAEEMRGFTGLTVRAMEAERRR